MKAVTVQYTVKPEFAVQNRVNIQKVMAALSEKPIDGMFYSSHSIEDGNTFLHINIARDQATLARLGEVPEFKEFQAALQASGPLAPPARTDLETVGVGFAV